MDLEKNLRERCRIISGDDGDRFVGCMPISKSSGISSEQDDITLKLIPNSERVPKETLHGLAQ